VIWFWNFMLYSFLGFLLEVAFARATGGRSDRKCLLVLPLCPVYGLGASAILLLPRWVRAAPVLLFLLGGLAATATEYGMSVFYEKILGVSFWDYHGLPGSVRGRVCLPFSLVWGLLALPLVYWLHPLLTPWLRSIPIPVTWMAAATLLADVLLSTYLLKRTGDRKCLRWYEGT
jgi:uncharacterized membrane protein